MTLHTLKSQKKMIEGRIKPPIIELKNEKIISRHLYSIAIADFFRKFSDYFGDADSFFRFEEGISGTERIKEYLPTKPESILKSLKRVIPEDLQKVFGVDDWK